jgi:acyl-CoA thioesterase-1
LVSKIAGRRSALEVLIRACILLVLLVPVSAEAEDLYDAFGDSITEGFDAEQGGLTGGYEAYLEPMLSRRVGPSVVVNSGLVGETTTQGTVRLPEVLAAVNPRFLLLMEGTNDISHFASIETIVENLRTMVDAALGQNVRPILATVIPRDTSLDDRDPGNALALALSGEIRNLAAEKGLQVADQFSRFGGIDPDLSYYSDPLHPNQAGYVLMADEWLEAILREMQAAGDRTGDIDHSGRVDGWDLFLLAVSFGSRTGSADFDPAADLNLDGIVDGDDLAILGSHFGQNV